MPLTKLQFKPGINKEGTTYSNEGGYFNCDKVRFRSGYAEKLGGWINQSFSFTFKGVARTLFNWVTYDGSNLLSVGTSNRYYVELGGQYNDVTPLVSATATTLGANPIATTNGSKLVTITAAGHGTTAGTYVTITSTLAVGGLTISGEYEVVSTPTTGTFTIASPTAASSTATGGGTVS